MKNYIVMCVMQDFERKFFIKDLYDSKKVLNSFDWVQFESFKLFLDCYMNGLYTPHRVLEIFIHYKEEYLDLEELSNQTEINVKALCIRVFNKELAEFIINKMGNKEFFLLLDFEEYVTDYKFYIPFMKEKFFHIKENVLKIIKINRDNYAIKINDISREFLKSRVRKFKLEFDYKSFATMPVYELEALQYWLSQIRILAAYKDKIKKSIEVLKKENFYKPIFVANDLKLYINERKEKWCFDLKKYLNCDGETIYFTELNNLRKYVDMKEETIVSMYPIENWILVDYSQNPFVNEIPLMTNLIDRWLYGKY